MDECSPFRAKGRNLWADIEKHRQRQRSLSDYDKGWNAAISAAVGVVRELSKADTAHARLFVYALPTESEIAALRRKAEVK